MAFGPRKSVVIIRGKQLDYLFQGIKTEIEATNPLEHLVHVEVDSEFP